jgi:hypothetical protein
MSSELELLNAVSTQPYAACESQWKELLRSLYLPIGYVPAIQSVLEKGRWKSQPDPMAYVRKSSLRCAVRLGILDVRPNRRREILASDLQYKDADGKSLDHDDRLGAALHRHDEQFRTGLGAESGSIYDEDDITDRLPSSVLDENLEVVWDRVAELARMDSGERIVLQLQRRGLGRRGALAACYTDEDKKLLEAAWRRFDRKKEALREVLQSGKAIPTKRQGGNAGDQPRAEVEMVLIEVPRKGMKISFRKRVANRPA